MSVRHLFKKQTNKLNIIFTINNNFVDVFVSTSINFEYFKRYQVIGVKWEDQAVLYMFQI